MKKYAFLLLLFIGCSFPYIPIQTSGDCFDRSCAIKQDLVEKGYETRLVLGYHKKLKIGHAWVEYKDKKTNEWKRIDNY